MSIADQITRLQNAKASIKTSIENKGVSVGDDVKLDGYPALIDSIEVGGSGETYINPEFYEVRTQNGTNFDNLFRGYSGPDIDVSKWDTSKVASAQYCFSQCTKSMDISNWDLSGLTNATYMFHYFTNNNKYIDLSVLDFSNLTNAQYMFYNSNTDYLDVRNIKLPKATNYNYLFSYCYGTELDLSSWDISKITDMSGMFNGAYFKKIDLTGWNTTKVNYMSYMFHGYSNPLEELIIPDWDMTNVTSIIYFMGSVPKLKYIDLSRSNDLTIKKIASFLPTKTATTYGEILIPADTSQDAIDALIAKYWKPIGVYFDLNSTELVLELDEIKPGKTTKVLTSNSDPWYGDDRLETIEFISSNESIATINGREITGVAEGTVDIICRRRADSVELGSTTLTVSETDSNPNLIKFRTNGAESNYTTLIIVNGIDIAANKCTKDPITGIYSYNPGKQIAKIQFSLSYGAGYVKEIIKFNFNATNITDMTSMFKGYGGTTLDLSDWDTSNVINMNFAFQETNYLTTIIGYLDCSNLSKGLYDGGGNHPFYKATALEDLYLKNIYKNCTMTNESKWGISLRDTKVKDECLIYIINELPDLINDKGLTATDRIILTLPPTNKLTAEQVQPAIDKGWTCVNCNF